MTYATDFDRFQFQRDCVARTTGTVLNVGCHIDGASLRGSWPDRVLNCDVAVQQGYDYHVDHFFDARGEWPFEDSSVEMVVLADILEHFWDAEILHALAEARRVSAKLCVTVPHDLLLQDELVNPEATYKPHVNTIDEEKIRDMLLAANWVPVEFHVITYQGGSVPSAGYLIEAC